MAKKMFFKNSRDYTIALVKRPKNSGRMMLKQGEFVEGVDYQEFSTAVDPQRGFLLPVDEKDVDMSKLAYSQTDFEEARDAALAAEEAPEVLDTPEDTDEEPEGEEDPTEPAEEPTLSEEELMEFYKKDLVAMAEAAGLSSEGTKKEIVARLLG